MVTQRNGCQSLESGQEAWQLNSKGFSDVAPPKNPGIQVELSFSKSVQSYKNNIKVQCIITQATQLEEAAVTSNTPLSQTTVLERHIKRTFL